MKITKLEKINVDQLKQYNNQKKVRRNRESKGGYEYIVYATDQDLD